MLYVVYLWLNSPICPCFYHLKCKNKVSFPGGPEVKNLPANAGDMGLIPDAGGSHMAWSN